MIRRPPRSTQSRSSAASDVYKRQRRDDTPDAARIRQGAEEDVRGAAPGRPAALEPVPLDLVARRVLDLDRGPAADTGATLAVRPEAVLADAPGERRIAAGIAERHDLVEERRQPEVRVVGEARREVRDERVRAGRGRPGS